MTSFRCCSQIRRDTNDVFSILQNYFAIDRPSCVLKEAG